MRSLVAPSPWRAPRAGFTLVELAAATVLSAIIGLAVMQALLHSQRAFSSNTAMVQATQRAQLALHHIQSDLMRTGLTVEDATTHRPVAFLIGQPRFDWTRNPKVAPVWIPPTPPRWPYTAYYVGGLPRTGFVRPSPFTMPAATMPTTWPNSVLQLSMQRGTNPRRPGATGWSGGIWYELWPEMYNGRPRILSSPIVLPVDTDRDGLAGRFDTTPPSMSAYYATQLGEPRGDYLITYHTWNLLRVVENNNGTYSRESIATGLVYLELSQGRVEQGTGADLVTIRIVAVADDRLNAPLIYAKELSERVEVRN